MSVIDKIPSNAHVELVSLTPFENGVATITLNAAERDEMNLPKGLMYKLHLSATTKGSVSLFAIHKNYQQMDMDENLLNSIKNYVLPHIRKEGISRSVGVENLPLDSDLRAMLQYGTYNYNSLGYTTKSQYLVDGKIAVSCTIVEESSGQMNRHYIGHGDFEGINSIEARDLYLHLRDLNSAL